MAATEEMCCVWFSFDALRVLSLYIKLLTNVSGYCLLGQPANKQTKDAVMRECARRRIRRY